LSPDLRAKIANANHGGHGAGRDTNCVNVALAVARDLNGGHVVAKGDTSHHGVEMSLSAHGQGTNLAHNAVTQQFGGHFVPSNSAHIEKALQAAGHGANGVIEIPGHMMNVVNDHGTVKFIDGQNGHTYSSAQFAKMESEWSHSRPTFFLPTGGNVNVHAATAHAPKGYHAGQQEAVMGTNMRPPTPEIAKQMLRQNAAEVRNQPVPQGQSKARGGAPAPTEPPMTPEQWSAKMTLTAAQVNNGALGGGGPSPVTPLGKAAAAGLKEAAGTAQHIPGAALNPANTPEIVDAALRGASKLPTHALDGTHNPAVGAALGAAGKVVSLAHQDYKNSKGK
jgi:hypothetical protein